MAISTHVILLSALPPTLCDLEWCSTSKSMRSLNEHVHLIHSNLFIEHWLWRSMLGYILKRATWEQPGPAHVLRNHQARPSLAVKKAQVEWRLFVFLDPSTAFCGRKNYSSATAYRCTDVECLCAANNPNWGRDALYRWSQHWSMQVWIS